MNELSLNTEGICISDRVFGYLTLIENKKIIHDKKTWDDIYDLYKDLRVDGFLGNHNPKTIAVGIIYTIIMKNQITVTQRDIAEEAGVTESTVRAKYILIRQHLDKNYTPSRNTTRPDVKGKYVIINTLNEPIPKIPKNQIIKGKPCCKHDYHWRLYACKICGVRLYHLRNIEEHYKKEHVLKKEEKK